MLNIHLLFVSHLRINHYIILTVITQYIKYFNLYMAFSIYDIF